MLVVFGNASGLYSYKMKIMWATEPTSGLSILRHLVNLKLVDKAVDSTEIELSGSNLSSEKL